MPNVNDLKQSKYLKQQDVGTGVLVTIAKYEELNVAPEGQGEGLKWVLWFKELAKPMVLNSTNGQLLEKITGSGDFDDWIGKVVVLYNDPNVSFAGKITGGIRVRAQRTAAQAPKQTGGRSTVPPAQVAAPELSDEDIPF